MKYLFKHKKKSNRCVPGIIKYVALNKDGRIYGTDGWVWKMLGRTPQDSYHLFKRFLGTSILDVELLIIKKED